MELFLPIGVLKMILPLLAIIAGVFVITTKNAIISVFNLIVLYILVAFYLIYIGITYLGISYIVIYIGAIAILFLFVIMMIDIEVVEKRSNNYLPLLFLLLGGFFFALKNIFYNIGLIKMKSLSINEKKKSAIDDNLFTINTNNLNEELLNEYNSSLSLDQKKNVDSNINLNNIENNFSKNDIKNFILHKDDDFNKLTSEKLKMDLNPENISENLTKYQSNIDISFNNLTMYEYGEELQNYNYLIVVPNWDYAANRVTQISALGDVLYTVYHSYIYIISVLLLLGMIGAIILTGDTNQEVRKFSSVSYINYNSELYKKNSFYYPLFRLNYIKGKYIDLIVLYLMYKNIFLRNFKYIINTNIVIMKKLFSLFVYTKKKKIWVLFYRFWKIHIIIIYILRV